MSRWSAFADMWDPDRDPAVRRLRDALNPPQPAQEPRGAEEAPVVVPEAIDEVIAAPAESGKRETIASLVELVRAGDLEAADRLRELIG